MILIVILRLLSGELEELPIVLPLATNQLQCIAGAQQVLAEKMPLYPGATVERIGCERRRG
jgi:hypothetical protein